LAQQTAKKTDVTKAKPILKWAGGKTQMLGDLMPKVPSSYGRYIEPFLGGGAMFFALQPENAVIADSNPELINMYREVASHVDEVILCLQKYENTPDMFYAVRAQEWSALPKAEAAARTIFLNKTCFNGLYRVNSSGYFNAPYGKYVNPNIVNENVILDVSRYLNWADIKIFSGDYRNVLKNILPGSFIYLDPPYMPIGETSFTSYTADKFDKEDQIALKKECDCLNKKDIKFLLSNSSCEFIEDLYEQYIITRIPAKRSINSCGNKRGSVEELLIRNY